MRKKGIFSQNRKTLNFIEKTVAWNRKIEKIQKFQGT